jgi:hypothetical protein
MNYKLENMLAELRFKEATVDEHATRGVRLNEQQMHEDLIDRYNVDQETIDYCIQKIRCDRPTDEIIYEVERGIRYYQRFEGTGNGEANYQ